MTGVSYGLADYRTGGPILDLPVCEGSSWTEQLNRADSLTCVVNMRDPDALALDLRSASEPKKTVLFARNDADVVLAWGLIDDDREWDEDKRTLTLNAKGILASWLGASIIGPADALTEDLVTDGVPNPALDTTLTGWSLGTIGKKLVEQRLTWPGSPSSSVFVLPADEVGTHERTYPFPPLKKIGSALTDLTNVDNGPDFAFDCQRASDGLHLEYRMRHGSEAAPRLGVDAGVWSVAGPLAPIAGLKVRDNASSLGTAAWINGGKTAGEVMMSRALNDTLIADGYPPLDYVDTARNDVTEQATLDSYVIGARDYASRAVRSLSFTVRGDATPGLGQFRSGDTVTLAVPAGHPWLTADILVRITSVGGDETGKVLTIGCEVIG